MSNHLEGNFVLKGAKTPVWQKPGYLTNSQISVGSRRLTQTSLYDPDNYRDHRQTASHHGSSRHAHSNGYGLTPDDLSSHGTMNRKSVTFTKGGVSPLTNGVGASAEPLTNGLTNGDLSGHESDHSGSNAPKSRDERSWYTNPLHLERKDYISTYQDIGLMNNSISPISQPGRTHGGHLSTEKAESASSEATGSSSPARMPASPFHVTSQNDIARDYFPITLGAAYALQSGDPSLGKTVSPPAKGLPRPSSAPWKPHRRTKSPSRKSRPGSAHSSSSSNSKSSLDKMYLMAVEAPTFGAGGTVLLSSPYQQELGRLRMDRLRIEEDHLLEVKRREELERIRGPQPKWYEMKTPRFHYEAHKNTELLKNKKDWQALVDYRGELERASKNFQQHQQQQQQQNGAFAQSS